MKHLNTLPQLYVDPVDICGTLEGESPDGVLLSGTVVGENPDHVCWEHCTLRKILSLNI